jgi:hypothetical protein
MSAFSWYRSRLQSMSGRELMWRGARAFDGVLPDTLRHSGVDSLSSGDWEGSLERFRAATDRPVLLDRDRARRMARNHPGRAAEVARAADAVMGNSFQFFGYPAVTLHEPINWNHDPIADHTWPDRPAERIDHRSAGCDVKWIWELNRLQHLPWLAQAWLFTGDDRYSKAAFAHLDSWMDQNPPGHGIAWRGAFEAGIRAISVGVALQGLRDSPDLDVRRYRRIVEMLAQSASRCWRDRSLYSSANNHLIGEMAGLAITSMLLPDLRHSSKWERRAVDRLAVEAPKQILADGAGAEQAVAYQVFTVELIHLVAALLSQKRRAVPEPLTAAVDRSTVFLLANGDPAPRYGDDDGGFALRLGPEPLRTVTDHLGIVGPFCGHPPGEARESIDAVWFFELMPTAPARRVRPPAAPAGSFTAPNGGLVVLRNGDLRATMDVGPLGYLSIAAHGHADALAVTLSDGAQDLISDPGTGSYYGHPDWRAVMRGTRAHPTVCIDGRDQSDSGGPFLWTRHAEVRVLGIDVAAGVVDAEHDGYSHLPGGVTHRRWLIARAGDQTHLIVDMISGSGHHDLRTSWPLHPSLNADRVGDGHLATLDGKPVLQLLYSATVPLNTEEVRGDTTNNLGWWAEELESRVPAWWLSAACHGELPVVVASLLSQPRKVHTEDLSVQLLDDRIHVRWNENHHPRTMSIRTDAPAAVENR